MHLPSVEGFTPRRPESAGVGVGLVIPSLTGAVAATLPPARLATGIAVQTTGRQLGSALGFAILIAVLGTPRTAQDFTGAWELMLLVSLLAGVALAGVGGLPAGAPDIGEETRRSREQESDTSLVLGHPAT